MHTLHSMLCGSNPLDLFLYTAWAELQGVQFPESLGTPCKCMLKCRYKRAPASYQITGTCKEPQKALDLISAPSM